MKLENTIIRGLLASKPAATSVAEGTLYFSTDAGMVERSNGTTWDVCLAEFYGSVTLTDGVATPVCEIPIAAGEFLGGFIFYSIYVSNATPDYQSHTGLIVFDAINKAGTVTSDIEETYLPASESEVVSAGTLSDDWTITNGADKITLNVNANTSLAGVTITVKFHIKLHSPNVVTIL